MKTLWPRESKRYSLRKKKIKDVCFTIESDTAGQRLDTFIAGCLDDCSRSHAGLLIRQGFIRVNGQCCKAGYRVKTNDSITATLPPPIPTDLVAEPLSLDILFEDRDLLIINKPADLVVHPAAGHSTGTLVHGILYHCPDLEGIGMEKRPGIVHRLDKDTSGILVVAKNGRAHMDLSRQFKVRSIEKHYLALVVGSPKSSQGRIDLPVGRHPVERKKMSTLSNRGREALTLWRIRERFEGATLLDVELRTGRTHQIRVHCQAMGFPIVGDPVYGGKGASRNIAAGNSALQTAFKSVQRQMLHAWRLGFSHPADGRALSFEAPLPADMALLLDHLRTSNERIIAKTH
jgi:23S rRNA pseudouridine1911/1915/1917 synthase